jgi:hypothetical protein
MRNKNLVRLGTLKKRQEKTKKKEVLGFSGGDNYVDVFFIMDSINFKIKSIQFFEGVHMSMMYMHFIGVAVSKKSCCCGTLWEVALGYWQEEILPVADSKMGFQGFFFSGSSPCHAEEDQKARWMEGELFSSQCFEFTPLHLLLCPCYLLCTLKHTHGPAFDQPERTTALATSRRSR